MNAETPIYKNSNNLRIGIVLAGGMNKGAYEIGCLNAIEDFFGKESIKVISASSIGSLCAYTFSCGKLDDFANIWKGLKVKTVGRNFLRMIANPEVISHIHTVVDETEMTPQVYITLWNFSKMKTEYRLLNAETVEDKRGSMIAAMTVPVLGGTGVKMNDMTYYDGALIDNIPVYPVIDKDLDYIVCIYFDGKKYVFEDENFDSKIIKISSFPLNKSLIEDFSFVPERIDEMIDYGYNYTMHKLEKVFCGETIDVTAGDEWDETVHTKKRMTSEVVLKMLNRMTKKYAKKGRETNETEQ